MEEGVHAGTMTSVSRSRFSRFTGREVDALYAFLQAARMPLEDESRLEAVLDDQ